MNILKYIYFVNFIQKWRHSCGSFYLYINIIHLKMIGHFLIVFICSDVFHSF